MTAAFAAGYTVAVLMLAAIPFGAIVRHRAHPRGFYRERR